VLPIMNLQSNIPKIYSFSFFYMFLVIVPLLVPFFHKLGLTMEQVFISQAAFGLSMALFEVPSAYLGDLWGRKQVMILGSFITGLGFSLLHYVEGFYGVLAYELLLGIGASFVSGADLAVLYDSIGKTERVVKTQAIGKLHMYRLTSESLASVLAGLVVAYGFSAVLWAQTLFGWVPFFISLTIIEPPIEKMSNKTHLDNFKEVFTHIFTQDSFLRLIFINMVSWSLATFTVIWILQKYWMLQDVNISNIAYLWAGFNFFAAVLGRYVHHLESLLGPIKLLSIMGLSVIIGYYGMGLTGGAVGIALTILFYASRAINMVVMKDAYNWRVPDKFRNTANSLSSLFFRSTFFIIGPAVGFSIDKFGLNQTLLYIGHFYTIIFIFLLIPLLKKIKAIKPNLA
jgi:MFS family permease